MASSAFTRTGWWANAALGLSKALLTVVLSAVAGAGLAAFASRFDSLAPAIIIGIPITILLAVAVLADARVGVLGVLATFPLGSLSIPLGIAALQIAEAAAVAVGGLVILRRLGERRT